MSLNLQLFLILGSIGMYSFIIYRIRQSHVRIEDVIIWILSSAVLLVFSIFPAIPMALARMLGFMSASNFIFTGLIFFLLLVIFGQGLKLSRQQEQIKALAQEIALSNASKKMND